MAALRINGSTNSIYLLDDHDNTLHEWYFSKGNLHHTLFLYVQHNLKRRWDTVEIHLFVDRSEVQVNEQLYDCQNSFYLTLDSDSSILCYAMIPHGFIHDFEPQS